MPRPTASDVHVNAPLTNISIAYIQQASDFVASRVFPNVPVQKQSDLYFTYTKADWLRLDAQRRAPGTESAGSGWGLSTASYLADVWAIHKDVDDQIRANADSPLDMDRDATIYVTQQLLLRKEREFVSTYMTTGVWGVDRAGVAAGPTGNQFLCWNVANSTPIQNIHFDILRITSLTGMRPNKLVLGADSYNALIDHPDIIARVSGGSTVGSPAIANVDLLARIFGVDEVLVLWATHNTATEGATAAYSFMASDVALLCYSAPSPSIMMPSAGYTFSWTGYQGAGSAGNRISRFRMPQLRSDRIEGEMAFDLAVVAADCGVFYSNTVN